MGLLLHVLLGLSLGAGLCTSSLWAQDAAAPASGVAAFTGGFRGVADLPGLSGAPVQLGLRPAPDLGVHGVAGELRLPECTAWIEGLVDAADGSVEFHGMFPWGWEGGELSVGDARGLEGSLRVRGVSVEVKLHREVGREIQEVRRPHTAPTNNHQRRVSRGGLPADVGADLDAAMVAAMTEQQMVGMTVAIARDGHLFDVRGYGLQDASTGTAATGDSRYRWASVSKTLTAAVALRLVRDGTLDLDQDVRKLVPEYPDHGAAISARQLLGHLGGVCHYRTAKRTAGSFRGDHALLDPILALSMFEQSPLVGPPGQQYHYSTHGYVLLGAALQRAGGRPFAELVDSLVTQPLGLATLVPDRDGDRPPNQVVGYQRVPALRGRPATMLSSPWETVEWKLAAGGFTSIAGDMARFGAGLMNGQLLQAEEFQAMVTPGQPRGGEPTSYGLGLSRTMVDGEQLFGHSGSQNQTATMLLLDPVRNLSIAVAINTFRADARALAREVWRRVHQVSRVEDADYTMVLLKTGSAVDLSADEQTQAFQGHFANMKRRAQEGYLLLAGPYGDPKADPALRGVLLFDSTDEAKVRAMIATDPTVARGVFTPELFALRGPTALRRVGDLEQALREQLPKDAGPGATGRAYVLATCAAAEGLRRGLQPLFDGGHVSWFATTGANQEGALFVLKVETVEAAERLLQECNTDHELGLSSWYATKAIAELPEYGAPR